MYSFFFLGGWLSPFDLFFSSGADIIGNQGIFSSFWFGIKIVFMVILFVWIRAALPRYRYDQLMNLGWKVFLPLSIFYLLVIFFIIISTNSLP